jgi:hypothetical protein
MLAALLLCQGCRPEGRGHTTFTSRSYPISGIQGPLRGPKGTEKALLVKNHPAELIWLTGMSCPRLVDASGRELPLAMMSLCHLDLRNVPRHADLMGTQHRPNGRLFSLGQGVTQVQLPAGFGIPMMSSEPLLVTTGVMNLDPYLPETRASVEVDVTFLYQRGLSRPLVPLWEASAYALISLGPRPACYGVQTPNPPVHGDGCARLRPATRQVFQDPYKRRFSADWMAPPGELVTRTLVSRLLNLPYDTTLHAATAQLLPGVRRIELRDRTKLKSLLTLDIPERKADGTAAQVPSFTSLEGIPVYADHEYELVVTTRNPGKAPMPARAVLHVYLRDKEFSLSSGGS